MKRKTEREGLWAALRRWFAAIAPRPDRPVRAAEEIDSHLAASLPAECVSAVLRSRRQ